MHTCMCTDANAHKYTHRHTLTHRHRHNTHTHRHTHTHTHYTQTHNIHYTYYTLGEYITDLTYLMTLHPLHYYKHLENSLIHWYHQTSNLVVDSLHNNTYDQTNILTIVLPGSDSGSGITGSGPTG